MKFKVLFAAVLMIAVHTAKAQKMVIGQRAPEVTVSQWLNAKPREGAAMLIHFFHSSSKESTDQLREMDSYAKKYAGKMAVVVIGRENKDKISGTLLDGKPEYSAALDDNGKTFSAYSVQYVPFGVLIDRKSKIVWFGNPGTLTAQTIENALK